MTELQQKILFYTSEGYEAKEIGAMLKQGQPYIEKELRLFRAKFKCRKTIQLIKVLCYRGIMQEIEKQYIEV